MRGLKYPHRLITLSIAAIARNLKSTVADMLQRDRALMSPREVDSTQSLRGPYRAELQRHHPQTTQPKPTEHFRAQVHGPRFGGS